MLSYANIKSNPYIFEHSTGLTLQRFSHLLESFRQAYSQALIQADNHRPEPRQRQVGGGRRPTLDTLEDKLLFILFYHKFRPTQSVQGLIFGLGQPQANEWIHRLTPVLNDALGYEPQLPAEKISNIDQLVQEYPELAKIFNQIPYKGNGR